MFYTKVRRSATLIRRIKKALITARRFSHIIIRCATKKTLAPNFSRSTSAELADIVLTDLITRSSEDIRELTERIDMMRWGHAMISPRTNFMWSGARDEAQKPFRNIHFAHSDLSGIALFEEAFFHGMSSGKSDDFAETNMTVFLSIVALISAIITIAAKVRENHEWQYVFKPLTMVAIIATAF